MAKQFSKYLKNDPGSDGFIFVGESAKAYIPQRYTVHDLLIVENTVKALGIFTIEVEGDTQKYNLMFPAILEMMPSDTYQQKIDNVEYTVLVFKKGDPFLVSKTMIKQSFILGKMFIEFTRNGNIPPFVSYSQLSTLMDVAQETCGVSLKVLHSIFEMMAAFQARDPNNLNVQYRHTDMKNPAAYLGLRNTTSIRDSATSGLLGSYFMEGLNRSLINQSEQQHEIEDLLRT
jgi:hypothetical protein